jgi:hypothetical protein
VEPPELPCVGRWALEPRGHMAPPKLPCTGRWAIEPPQSCLEPGRGRRHLGDTWRFRSCPTPGGGHRSCGDMWRPWSYPKTGGGSRSRRGTWRPQSCPVPGARYHSTTPPLRPFVRGKGVVVPVTPPDNPHRMITWGKTSFKVVPDRLVLTMATSSPMLSPIPSSARATLADPHWRAAMEDKYRALISNGT